MKRLYLLRHAEAPSSFDLPDKDRPLSPRGRNQAKSVAAHIPQIDMILCSDAVRTKMTCEALLEAGAKVGRIEYLDTLYNAPAGTLLAAIQSAEADKLMIIAHNPGIHMLANMLAKEESSENFEKLNLYYHPATLSIFDCAIDSWHDIQPRENTFVDLIIPDVK